MKTAAFFDVDGTLFTANMWRGLMEYAAQHGRKNRVRVYMATLMPLVLWRALRLISEEDFRKPWVLKLGWLVEGWSEQEGLAALRWVAEEYIRPTALDVTIARLREHVTRGDAVFLVSAMLKPTLRVIGDMLGVTDVIGTEIEINAGRFTGVVSPRVCMGIEKQRLARELIAARGFAIDFANSYAYADSISDLPLFEMVGKPVAVYPNKELLAYAQAQKWQMISGR